MELAWEIVLAIGAAILVAVATAVGGYFVSNKRYKAKIKDAPSVYTERLGGLIEVAYSEGPERAVINASAIVSVRNEMRISLISISNSLNSEISRMEQLLGGKARNSRNYDPWKSQRARRKATYPLTGYFN
jgi:hypothetical protein